MQGQDGNSTIVEIVQEDFVESPRGDAIMEVWHDVEGVGEAGLFREFASVHGIRGLTKLLGVDVVVGVKKVLKDLRRHGHPTQAGEDAVESAVFHCWERAIGHQGRDSGTISPRPKAFQEQRIKGVHREDQGV